MAHIISGAFGMLSVALPLLPVFGSLGNATVETITVPSVGDVSLVCKHSGAWRFSLTAEKAEDGVDVVRVCLVTDSPQPPPTFDIAWFVSQRDIHHFWTCESTHYGIPWRDPVRSEISNGMPLYAFLDANDGNRFTCASSESCRTVIFRAPISEIMMGFNCRFSFFTVPEAPLSAYETCIRLDKSDRFYAEAIGSAADWICQEAGLRPMKSPDVAYSPLYSTWYVFHQELAADQVEAELREAAELGMKNVIVDDGWQIDLPLGNRGGGWGAYSLCGDWRPGCNFPDMAEHVKRVHFLGFRYLLWYSVPFVGENSDCYGRFKGKFLPKEQSSGGGWVLDPRFPDVREYLIGTYEEAVRKWDVDGFKLDFIGRFSLKPGVADLAIAEKFAGRDIKSIPLAVERLLADSIARLKALKPDILVEFRQPYLGPCIRSFGNMIRATDCPCSMVENRTRTARLRLTSGNTAVHSDMLEWRTDETPESAARCIINALFSVVQYSVRLKTLPESHRRMVAHWIQFSQEHREALVKGAFRPHYPAADYPLLEGESAAERVFGVYQENLAVDVGAADKPVVVMNGANAGQLLLVLPVTPEKVEVFDTFGNRVTAPALKAGVNSALVPVSGYLKLTWKAGGADGRFASRPSTTTVRVTADSRPLGERSARLRRSARRIPTSSRGRR